MVLDTSLFNTQYYKVQIKGKVEQSSTPSSSYQKVSLQVILDYGCQLTLFYYIYRERGIYIYIYTKDSKNATLLNAQHHQVSIKGKLEQSRERGSGLLYTLV